MIAFSLISIFSEAKFNMSSKDEQSPTFLASSHIKRLTDHCARMIKIAQANNFPNQSTSQNVIDLGILKGLTFLNHINIPR